MMSDIPEIQSNTICECLTPAGHWHAYKTRKDKNEAALYF